MSGNRPLGPIDEDKEAKGKIERQNAGVFEAKPQPDKLDAKKPVRKPQPNLLKPRPMTTVAQQQMARQVTGMEKYGVPAVSKSEEPKTKTDNPTRPRSKGSI